ncbi:resolvase [Sporomusa acidovorans]|uniref:YqgF/RNase H-like domain-containing protein n=1 Tax=Sporomusa acidovorans (strain ATCC 49682 / DSM 3132 / Mol) TaxID=1123286 RepID=A0ABZ3J712_SPOA4|nr:resolvase [Sporomusa acidovorans]OZC19313.1 hypothetical protein SPACI_29030 [Sporomusa acidovorans DSM 3132]SDD81099.1 hypothetical protein SAMN04488499_1004115 [Sporomusa acidovorans]
MQELQILAVDPGREKCGLAVVHREQGPVYQTVIETNKLTATVTFLAQMHMLTTVVIGDGTTSRSAQQALKSVRMAGKALTVIPVGEYRSTDEARKRYWQAHPPAGWKRLLPTTMLVPPVPVDDYVAVILAERYFGKR